MNTKVGLLKELENRVVSGDYQIGDWINSLDGEARVNRIDWMGYYFFLHLLVKEIKPKLIVELGTNKASSAVFMKQAYPQTRLITIDIENFRPDLINKYELEFILGDSVKSKDKIPDNIDLLFVDTIHTNEQAELETEAYLPKMKKGGLVAYDDIDIIKVFWQTLPPPKVELNNLHWTGFGVKIV